jgi:hypothetical protein
MSDVVWPVYLPTDQAYGFTETPVGVSSWAPGDWQEPLRRKRTSGSAVTTSYPFVMNNLQMSLFRTWWEVDLARGVNNILFMDRALGGQVRLSPLAQYQATATTYNAWSVIIPVRRQLVS